MGNMVDGTSLKGFTMEKLAEEYGVSDEAQRKKIYYNLKDILRKDNSSVRAAIRQRLPSPPFLPTRALPCMSLVALAPPPPRSSRRRVLRAGEHEPLHANANVGAAVRGDLLLSLPQVREADCQAAKEVEKVPG